MRTLRITTTLACLGAAGALAAPAQAEVTPTVTVAGDHVELVGNDASTVRFTVSKVRDTGREALAITSKRLRGVINRVKHAGGTEDADLSTGRISLPKLTFGDADGNPAGSRFRATQSATVTVLAVKRTGQVVNAGVAAGATDVGGPEFFVSDSDERYQDALLKAYDEAKAKAAALATRSGHELGEALSITEGGGVVFIEGSSNGAAFTGASSDTVSGPPAPVRSGKSRVRGRVTVVFELR